MTIKTKKNNIKMARFILYFFLVAMTLLAYLLSQNIIKSVSGYIKSINWIQVDATLLNASIKITNGSKSSSSPTQYTYYHPQISYKYNLSDVNCISSKVSWIGGGDDGVLKELAYKFKYHLKHNIPIKVFVNPDNPCDSVVDRAIHWSKLTSMGIILIIVALFACGIVYLLVKT